jgi:hypothetical protein
VRLASRRKGGIATLSESSKTSVWNSLLELFRPFEVAAGIAGIVTILLWFLSLPTIVLAIGGTVVVTLASVGIIGHVRHSRTEKLLSLGTLTNGQRKKLRPRSNLALLSVDYLDLHFDENGTLWEARQDMQGSLDVPSYCAVLRFANKPIAGAPGQPIKKLRASLAFRNLENGYEYAPIDRGAWVREEFNTFTLEVGDSRALVIARGFPPHIPRRPDVEVSWWIWPVINNHYSKENYGKVFFQRLKTAKAEVEVVVIAGDAGLVLYSETFIVQGEPHLEVILKPKDST